MGNDEKENRKIESNYWIWRGGDVNSVARGEFIVDDASLSPGWVFSSSSLLSSDHRHFSPGCRHC